MFFNGPSFALGFATGFGTGLFTREVARVTRASFRPAVKTVIRSSLTTVEKLRESFAVAGETFEDLVAEARAELTHREGTSEETAASLEDGAEGTGEKKKAAGSSHEKAEGRGAHSERETMRAKAAGKKG